MRKALLDLSKAQPVTQEKKRDIRQVNWAADSTHVLYANDTNGDENFHVFVVDAAGGPAKDVTPVEGARAGILAISPKVPGAQGFAAGAVQAKR